MAQNILAGLDAWLTTWPGAGGDLIKPEIQAAPASNHEGFVVSAVTSPVTTETAPDNMATSAQAIAWRPLADAYYRHHFGCLRCIAAGQNPKLHRCGAGAVLWQAYRGAMEGGQ